MQRCTGILGRVEVAWPVNLILLDMAQDPVGDWMLERVRPFYQRAAGTATSGRRLGRREIANWPELHRAAS